ncbi:transposase, MuDR, MULE transposase domain protein, partial [Tanacetum coccineum]
DTLPILLSFTHCGNKTILRVLRIILVILPEHPSETKVFHNEDGNPARANIQQALGSYERSHKGVKASANSDIVYFFTSAQDGDPLQDDVRLCLADDLKKAQDHNQRQVNDKLKDHYPKYLSGTVPGTVHYKVLDVSSYEKDITVGAAMILANVSVFTPKPSKHYLNITKRIVVEVFRKDTVSLA